MNSIKKIKTHIENELSLVFQRFDLKKARDFVFCQQRPEVTKIVEISFLRTKDASYFASTTASFSILFGGLFGESGFEKEKGFPASHFCQIRGQLLRDFPQKAPNLSLADIEHKRRDIWWIEKSEESIQIAIDGAKRSIESQLGKWLEKLEDRRYLCHFLHYEEDSETGLWGVGKIGSPARQNLIKVICHDIDEGTLSKKDTSLFEKLKNSFRRP